MRTAVAVAGCVATCCLLAACGQASSIAQQPTGSGARQECVQAVFDVLSGMVAKPYDSGPFDSFVTRYGTGSVTYNAYLDVFTSFYSLSSSGGVPGAESRLRPIVVRDCASAS